MERHDEPVIEEVDDEEQETVDVQVVEQDDYELVDRDMMVELPIMVVIDEEVDELEKQEKQMEYEEQVNVLI